MSCPFGHGRQQEGSVEERIEKRLAEEKLAQGESGKSDRVPYYGAGAFRTSLGSELAQPLKSWLALESKPGETVTVPEGKYTKTLTYWDYIHPDELTSLQSGREGKGLNHHDEHLFIVVHQVFELWFKQILYELDWVRDFLAGKEDSLTKDSPDLLARAAQRLDRADKILRLATEGYNIMETMDPADFLAFRDILSPASGFQSMQMRELEMLMGLRDEDRILCGGRPYQEAFVVGNGEDKLGPLRRRSKQPSLREVLPQFLARVEVKGGDIFLQRFLDLKRREQAAKMHELKQERAILDKMTPKDPEEEQYINRLRIKNEYQQQAATNAVAELEAFFTDKEQGKARLVALMAMTFPFSASFSKIARIISCILHLEQALILWRQRHARVAEFFIGRKMGTGGSSGVEYLDATSLQYRVFNDLWQIRSLAVPSARLDFDPDNPPKPNA